MFSNSSPTEYNPLSHDDHIFNPKTITPIVSNPKYVNILKISLPPTKILLDAPNIIINPFPNKNAQKHITAINLGFSPYLEKFGVVMAPLIYDPITICNPISILILSPFPKALNISIGCLLNA